MLHDEILQEAIDGKECTPEWAAMQTVRLYRQWSSNGLPHAEALEAARTEMRMIADEALQVRKRRRKNDLAAWCVVILGVLACVGWWLLWE
jgi:hypothetical protein